MAIERIYAHVRVSQRINGLSRLKGRSKMLDAILHWLCGIQTFFGVLEAIRSTETPGKNLRQDSHTSKFKASTHNFWPHTPIKFYRLFQCSSTSFSHTNLLRHLFASILSAIVENNVVAAFEVVATCQNPGSESILFSVCGGGWGR